MPVVLPEFRSWDELETWFNHEFADTNGNTYSRSYFDGLPDYEQYFYEVNRETNKRAKDSWVSKYLFDGLRKAPPIKEQAWLMNKIFFERASAYINIEATRVGSPVKDLLSIYNEYLPEQSKCTDPEVIQTYQQACRKFREHMNLTSSNYL